MDAIDELERGREFYRRSVWLDAFKALTLADAAVPLAAPDLELLATSAYLVGKGDDCVSALSRAHHAYLDGGMTPRAIRCGFWLVIQHALRGDMGGATGWLGRAQRLLEDEPPDCVERGYLLLPAVIHQRGAGEHEAAYVTAAEAAEIGARFREADLFSLALHEQGRARINQGAVDDGLALLDEAMVAVTAGELSPIVTGLIYCSVIDGCREVYALGRAQEWTAALTRWWTQQPDMVTFTGECLAFRAEIMVLHGAWREALDEVRRACERFSRAVDQAAAVAPNIYQQGEVHRLRGDVELAEDAYRSANHWGWQPQPGLALLRMAQGRPDAAASAIARVLGETAGRLARARLLPAFVEIMLSVGDTPQARSACSELAEIAASYGPGVLDAMAGLALGAVQLAEGDAGAALIALRQACRLWRDVEAPYQVACARVLMALACRKLGDDDAAAWELDAARSGFEELGAAPDLARVDALRPGASPGNPRGLTDRELQVLRLVAAGRSNREISSALVISERTVAPSAEHVRQARRLVANRRQRLRLRTSPRLSWAPRWSRMTTRSTTGLVIRTDAARGRPPYRRCGSPLPSGRTER